MLRQKIEYTNLDGERVAKDFYFSISMADLIAMGIDADSDGGYTTYLKNIVETNDNKKILAEFSKIIGEAVGERSPDGEWLDKGELVTKRFMNSDAYSELLWKMFTDAGFAAEFIAKTFPADFHEKVAAMGKNQPELPFNKEVQVVPLPPEKKLDEYSLSELQAMSTEEFNALIKGTHRMHWPQPVLMSAFQRQTSGG